MAGKRGRSEDSAPRPTEALSSIARPVKLERLYCQNLGQAPSYKISYVSRNFLSPRVACQWGFESPAPSLGIGSSARIRSHSQVEFKFIEVWSRKWAEHHTSPVSPCGAPSLYFRIEMPIQQCKSTETVFVLVTPTRLEPLLGRVVCSGCSGLLHPPGHF